MTVADANTFFKKFKSSMAKASQLLAGKEKEGIYFRSLTLFIYGEDYSNSRLELTTVNYDIERFKQLCRDIKFYVKEQKRGHELNNLINKLGFLSVYLMFGKLKNYRKIIIVPQFRQVDLKEIAIENAEVVINVEKINSIIEGLQAF